MRFFSSFDKAVGKKVGRIDDRYYAPFVWLGKLTSPIMWVGYLVLVHLLFLPLATIIKLAFRRVRPETIYTEHMKIKSYSFPSSHAYAGALSCGMIIRWLPDHLMYASAALLAIATLIGISRVRVGAHYPSDVLGGWSLALTVVVLSWWLV